MVYSKKFLFPIIDILEQRVLTCVLNCVQVYSVMGYLLLGYRFLLKVNSLNTLQTCFIHCIWISTNMGYSMQS